MEEISETSHDEYGVKAKGILPLTLELNWLPLTLVLNWAITAEVLSNTLQGKDTSFQKGMAAITLAKSFYKRKKKNIIVSMTELLEKLRK